MKRNPTLEEKKLLTKYGMNPKEWLIRKHTNDEIHIVNKNTGTKKIVPAE